MMQKIEDLFTFIIQISKEKRKLDEFDGLRFWQGIKSLLSVYDNIIMTWNMNIDMSKLTINEKNEHGHLIEIYHFMRQQSRIPSEDECTIRKIMQLALNIGQFLGINNDNCELIINENHYLSDKQSVYDFVSNNELLQLCENELFSNSIDDIIANIHCYTTNFT